MSVAAGSVLANWDSSSSRLHQHREAKGKIMKRHHGWLPQTPVCGVARLAAFLTRDPRTAGSGSALRPGHSFATRQASSRAASWPRCSTTRWDRRCWCTPAARPTQPVSAPTSVPRPTSSLVSRRRGDRPASRTDDRVHRSCTLRRIGRHRYPRHQQRPCSAHGQRAHLAHRDRNGQPSMACGGAGLGAAHL